MSTWLGSVFGDLTLKRYLTGHLSMGGPEEDYEIIEREAAVLLSMPRYLL